MRKLKLEELDRLSVTDFKSAEKLPIVLVLDSVRSMNNVGSIFRTSDAFAIEKLILCGITATPPHRDIEKTALGATKTVVWEYFTDTTEAIKKLKKQGYSIVAIEQADGSMDLCQYKPDRTKKYALVFGNEVFGVSDTAMELVNECIEIPQFGTKHSFNIVVSAGIVLWDFYVKLK